MRIIFTFLILLVCLNGIGQVNLRDMGVYKLPVIEDGLPVKTKLPEPSFRLICVVSKSAGEPLYVVNGTIEEFSTLRRLNPNDILIVRVLKNARACSKYGRRGLNGVILITTKKTNN